MAPARKRLGKDAVGCVLLNKVHPSHLVQNAYPNRVASQRLEGCVVARENRKKVAGNVQKVVVFTHKKFGPTKLHCVQ